MSVAVSIVNDKDEVLSVPNMRFLRLCDAAGHIDGSDFWSFVQMKFPGETVKEIRLHLSKPIKLEDEL